MSSKRGSEFEFWVSRASGWRLLPGCAFGEMEPDLGRDLDDLEVALSCRGGLAKLNSNSSPREAIEGGLRLGERDDERLGICGGPPGMLAAGADFSSCVDASS